MTSPANRRELFVRLAAAAITVVSLGALHSLASSPERPPETTVFALVFAVCGSYMLIARGLGHGVATGLGVVIALSISVALSNLTGAGATGNTFFMLVSISLMVFVGRIAGTSGGDAPPASAGLSDADRELVDSLQTGKVEQMLGALASDFCVWTSTDMVRANSDGRPPWPGFARFVRHLLVERLGASNVEVFEVVPGQPRLRPLAANRAQVERPPLADTGTLGAAIRSVDIHVDGDEPAESESGGVSRIARQRWTWVLPLRVADQTVAIVTIGAIESKINRRVGVAHAVRDLLQLFWAHVAGLQALGQARCTDSQTGLLTRTALLEALRDSELVENYADEPVAVLVVALEGLRRLDDRSQWAERDELIRRLGDTLCRRLHTDDLVARFADDRFVAVMLRTDAVLGKVAAGRLLDCIQSDVLDRIDPGETLGVRLRGGVAGGDAGRTPPDALLSRALQAVDEARAAGERFTVAAPPERRCLIPGQNADVVA